MQDQIEEQIITKIQEVVLEKTGISEEQIGKAFMEHSPKAEFKAGT